MNKIKLLLGLLVYKIAPVKKGRYVFTSFNGHYSDNTKYISIEMHKVDPSADIIWLLDDNHKNDVPHYVKVVDINSIKAYWYRGTATAQIDNVYGFRAIFKTGNGKIASIKRKIFEFLTNKKSQPIYSTMHGTPLKKLGRDQIGNTVLDMSCPNSYLLVGDRFTADVLRHITFDKMPLEVLGSPRNDILFDDITTKKEELNLPNNKKIILFAPTFRNDGKDVDEKNVYRSGINQLSELDFDQLFFKLSVKFGGEWVMVCRFHYHVAELVDWVALEKLYPGRFINGNLHDDMADYLACTDILLTDASSSMFDFSLTKKPCFLYFPDLDNYKNKERGFYMDIEELPFPLAIEFDTLLQNIDNFDQEKYGQGVEQLLFNIGSNNDGHAAERVVAYICKKI